MTTRAQKISGFLKRHRIKILIVLAVPVLFVVSVLVMSHLIIEKQKKFIVTEQTAPRTPVGIVLGAGVTADGKPYNELRARLDTAADALQAGVVGKLVLSGDNRFSNYDEPSAMYNYLVETKHISPDKLVRDFAGRSTFESCERAAKIFEIKSTILFSAESHLPRAIYLCRHFGIDAYGISSGVEANNSGRRELLARVKAIYNSKLIGERTILGDPIPVR